MEAIGTNTRVLALTHVSNISGLRLPIDKLCDIAHQHNIHVHVDGAQTWGAFNLNLRKLKCDSYAASSHKWLCGPKEVGLLYVKKIELGTSGPMWWVLDGGESTGPISRAPGNSSALVRETTLA